MTKVADIETMAWHDAEAEQDAGVVVRELLETLPEDPSLKQESEVVSDVVSDSRRPE